MTKIFIVDPNVPNVDESQNTSKNEIKEEKLVAESVSDERLKSFNAILYNVDIVDKASLIYIMYGFVGTLTSFLALAVITLIPMNNVITNPKYWYEGFFTNPVMSLIVSLFFTYNCSYWMNLERIKTCRSFSITLIFTTGSFMGFPLMVYGVWTYAFGYQWPVPFMGVLMTNFTYALCYMVIWHLFPQKWRNIGKFYSKLKFFCIALAFNQSTSLCYNFMVKTFLEYPEQYQWVLAIVSTVVREIFIWITKKVARKCCNGDPRRTTIVCSHLTNARHAIFLSTILGSIATQTTSIIILVMDSIINILLTLKLLVDTKYRKTANTEKKIELLQDLALNEIVEIIVPLTYLLCFVAAYYGPNAALIGNVQNDYWQYEKTENIDELIKNISVFVLVDVLSGIVCYFLLLWICKINLIRASATLLREFGLVFTINMTYLFFLVSSFYNAALFQ